MTIKSFLRCSWFCVFAATAVSLLGCGRPHETLYPVVGKVSFQGKPLAAGMIRFRNSQIGIDMVAEVRPDGTYEVVRAHGPGLPAGHYAVAVLPPRIDAPIGQPLPPPPKWPAIPAKYRQPATSGLTLSVKPGKNRLDVDIQP